MVYSDAYKHIERMERQKTHYKIMVGKGKRRHEHKLSGVPTSCLSWTRRQAQLVVTTLKSQHEDAKERGRVLGMNPDDYYKPVIIKTKRCSEKWD